MPKHRFYVPAERLAGGRAHFSVAQSRQIRGVLRLRGGECVRVFDGVAPVDRIVLLDAGARGEAAAGSIVGEHPRPAEPATHLVMYPALLPREKFEHVLQKLVEVGAAEIVPVVTMRSLVRDAPDEARLARWRAIIQEATEQCGRGVLPLLGTPRPFSDALQAATRDSLALLAYEREQALALRAALRDARGAGAVSLLVGPEGGYDPAEVDEARQAGALVVSLGPRILRTETASPIFAALVLYERERA